MLRRRERKRISSTEHTLSVFDQAEDAADPDQHAAGVEGVDASLPQPLGLHALARGHTQDAPVPNAGDDDEAGEEQDLDDEAADDDVLAGVHGVERAGRHDASACALHHERDDVADYEDLGEPAGSDQGVFFAFCDQDQAAEAHVDARSEDTRRHQNEYCVG